MVPQLCGLLQDKRIPIPEWPAYKPTTPFGQVPLLQIGDTIIAQSAAIGVYLDLQAGKTAAEM